MSNKNQPLTPAEQAELQRRFPRVAYWVGAAPLHPEIHGNEQDQDHPEHDTCRGIYSYSGL